MADFTNLDDDTLLTRLAETKVELERVQQARRIEKDPNIKSNVEKVGDFFLRRPMTRSLVDFGSEVGRVVSGQGLSPDKPTSDTVLDLRQQANDLRQKIRDLEDEADRRGIDELSDEQVAARANPDSPLSMLGEQSSVPPFSIAPTLTDRDLELAAQLDQNYPVSPGYGTVDANGNVDSVGADRLLIHFDRLSPEERAKRERARTWTQDRQRAIGPMGGAAGTRNEDFQPYRPSQAEQDGLVSTSTFKTYSYRDAIRIPYTRSSSWVRDMAKKLWAAGYLNQEVDWLQDLDAQMPGTAFDPRFQRAWVAWMDQSLQDRSKSAEEILRERMAANAEVLKISKDQALANELERRGVRLSDPETLRRNALFYGEQKLQRQLTADEQESLIAAVREQEFEQAVSTVTNPSTLRYDFDTTARLESLMDQRFGVEMEGVRTGETFASFRELLGGEF